MRIVVQSPSFNPAKVAIIGKRKGIKRLTICHQYELRDKHYVMRFCERFQQYDAMRRDKGSCFIVSVSPAPVKLYNRLGL